jgi:RNA polymerase sigma-70 factor (ECF subfamily)
MEKAPLSRELIPPTGVIISERLRGICMEQKLEALSDEDLLIMCKRASPEKARTIIGIIAKRFEVQLFSYLYRMVGSRTAAEDLLQEVFLRLYRNRDRYKRVAKCSTWLYRIATNLALNAIRDAKRHAKLSINAPLDASDEDFTSILPAPGEGPPDIVARKELVRIVREILDKLPEKYRSVMVLCDFEGFTYVNASEALEIEIGTVRSRLARARAHFQKMFAPHLSELETK